MPIVATAGHVDHGKSTLIEALTGRDPDRWSEEKQRGLTIDLGFAWRQIGGFDVGFVDVPGHERFIKNMLAGMGAIDVALFVVAADEGWMPQTEEHLAVLDLLGIRHGVIALTRVDLADDDVVDLAELEILERVEGTVLDNWPIVRVSPITGTGMDDLLRALEDRLQAAGEPSDRGRPRLWVDRSFHISGAGLVVTGTLAEGSVSAGDELMLWPGAAPVRVRGLQHHDTPVDTVGPGNRAALNLTGTENLGRGMLLARPGSVSTSSRLLVSLRTVRALEEDLTGRGAYHLHLGSGSWPIRLRILESGVGMIQTRSPVPVRCGDRFILRETGRRAVVAGGVVVDPHPPRSGKQAVAAVPGLLAALSESPDRVADVLLSIRGTAQMADLERDTGGGKPTTSYTTGSLAMADSAAHRLVDQVTDVTERFQHDHRLRPGIPKAELATTLGRGVDSITLVVSGTDGLVDDGATIRTADFDPGMSTAEENAWQAARLMLRAGFAVPRADQLGLDRELLHALIRENQMVRVSPDLVYLPEQIETITTALRTMEGEFTVADFRDLIGVSRRQAVPLLEWFDKQGITRRNGDTRVVRES
jgi:selenocysteine-specific elongation factor